MKTLRIFRSESGQSLVELAFLTPFLLLMLLGVIEMGRYAYIAILVGNAAHAGAAYGSQSLAQSVDTAAITSAADNDFQNNGQDVSKLSVTPSHLCGCDIAGKVTTEACTGVDSRTICGVGHWVVTVAVEADGTFGSMFSYPGIPKSITVDRTATMRVAQ